MKIPSYLEKDFTNIDYSNLRHGGEAFIFKAKLPSVQGDLAIKKWPSNLHKKNKKQRVRQEIRLLVKNDHKNIIKLLGILVNEKSEWIGYVMPYMERGSLHEIIHNRTHDGIYTKEQMTSWTIQICFGLSYLHSKDIIHRDIKPSNILLGNSYDDVKLSDFGIARSLEHITHSLTKEIGTLVYMAPEMLNSEDYDMSIDIYSLSITVWEILHRRAPFDHITVERRKLSEKIIDGERPRLKDDLSKEMSNLLTMLCWHGKASMRPKIDRIVDFLTKETILLTGGSNERTLNSLLLLVNDENNWKELNIKLPYPRSSHGAQFLNNNLYIFGGEKKGLKALSSTYKLVNSTQWEKMADMYEKRSGISNSNVILNNQIWVCGGRNEECEDLKSVEMYDPKTNEWKYMKEMNECRYNAATAVVNGKIFCSGGAFKTSVEYYDPSSDVWTLVCSMPQGIQGHGAVEMDGNLIIVGGYNIKYLDNRIFTFISRWVCNGWNISAKKARWIEKRSISISRGCFSIAKIDDEIFICGGNTEYGETDEVEIFDGKVWRKGLKMPTPRVDSAAVSIPMQFVRCLN